jgi:ribose/xylose/arabinose/galactoside ABC-type transport system permease subunit
VVKLDPQASELCGVTLLGALLVIIIQSGLNTVARDPYWQQIVFGAFTILAVFLNSEKGGRTFIVK